jgi:hypothetical protein
MKLPLVESIVNETSNFHQVQNAICTNVEGKEKLFMPKLDNLFKHANRPVQSQGFKTKSSN